MENEELLHYNQKLEYLLSNRIKRFKRTDLFKTQEFLINFRLAGKTFA